MPKFNFVILYVKSPIESAAFYSGLLGHPIVDQAETFAMLPLSEQVMLGLWSAATVAPAPGAGPGAGEVAFTVEAPGEVDATHDAWKAKGLTIAQAPTDMDFGRSFVALDPDGHRLRVFAPAG